MVESRQSILEMLVDEKIGAGMDPGEARREALMELGGAVQVNPVEVFRKE